MHLLTFLYPALLTTLSLASFGDAARSRAVTAVLLSGVKTLTLRKGFKTTARRVSAIPQVSFCVNLVLGV